MVFQTKSAVNFFLPPGHFVPFHAFYIPPSFPFSCHRMSPLSKAFPPPRSPYKLHRVDPHREMVSWDPHVTGNMAEHLELLFIQRKYHLRAPAEPDS